MKKFFTLLSVVYFWAILAGCDTNKVKVNFNLNYEGHLPACHPKMKKVQK